MPWLNQDPHENRYYMFLPRICKTTRQRLQLQQLMLKSGFHQLYFPKNFKVAKVCWICPIVSDNQRLKFQRQVQFAKFMQALKQSPLLLPEVPLDQDNILRIWSMFNQTFSNEWICARDDHGRDFLVEKWRMDSQTDAIPQRQLIFFGQDPASMMLQCGDLDQAYAFLDMLSVELHL